MVCWRSSPPRSRSTSRRERTSACLWPLCKAAGGQSCQECNSLAPPPGLRDNWPRGKNTNNNQLFSFPSFPPTNTLKKKKSKSQHEIATFKAADMDVKEAGKSVSWQLKSYLKKKIAVSIKENLDYWFCKPARSISEVWAAAFQVGFPVGSSVEVFSDCCSKGGFSKVT